MATQPRYHVPCNDKIIGIFDGGVMIARIVTGRVMPTDNCRAA
jgi:hypothetical protein